MTGAVSGPRGASARRRILLPGSIVRRQPGLVGWWTFESGTINGATVLDASGSGNHGTKTGTPTLSPGPKGGTAFQLVSSSGQSLTIGTGASLNLTGNMTISAWVKPVDFGGTARGRIFDKNGGNTGGYTFLVDNSNVTNGLSFGINSGTGTDFVSSNTNALATGVWQHVVAVYHSGTNAVELYTNGVNVGGGSLGAAPFDSSSIAACIGARSTDALRDYNGAIDDVRVYNRAFSQADVVQLFRNPLRDFKQPLDAVWSQLAKTVGTGRTGTLAQTIAAITSASTGTVLVSGTSTPTLSNLTSASAGTVKVTGSATPTIAALTLASAGTVKVTGTATPTIDAITSSSTGTVRVTGSEAVTIPNLTSASTGTVLVTGSEAVTVPNLTLSSTGTTPNVAVATPTITNLTLASTGTVLVSGTVSQTIPAITSSSAGTVLVTGTVSQTIPAITSSSAGTVLVSATLSATIDPITLVSAGTVSTAGSATGSFAQTLDDLTSSSTGTVLVKGTVSATIPAITLSTTGTVTKPASVKTIGAVGCDYTTIEAWAASLSGWIFGGDQEGVLKGEIFTPSNSFSFSGFTTSPTARLIIRCSTDLETLGNTQYDIGSDTGARITKTGGGGIGIISITDDNIKHWVVKGIGLYSNSSDNPGVFCNNAGFDAGLVENCYVHHVNANAYDMSAATGVGVARVLNSAAQEIAGNNVGILGVSGHSDRVSADFCTLVRHVNSLPNTGCGVRYVVARNTYAGLFGTNGTAFHDFSDLGTGSTNYASNDLTGSTSALQIVRPSEVFLSSGSVWDLTLSQLPNRLVAQGTPLTGVTTDALGNTRNNPDPDIGWSELPDRGDFSSFPELDVTLSNITLSSTGHVPSSLITGTLDATIDDLTSSAAATVRVGVYADATFPDLTLSSAGTVSNHGAVSATIDPLGLSTSGTVLVKGSLTATLGALALSAQATDPIVGTLASTVANLTVASAGVVYTSLVLSEAVQPITIASAGTVLVSGAVSDTIDPITVGSAASHPVKGSVSATLDNLTLAAPGTVLVTGTLSKTLANLTSSSAGNAYTPVVLVKTIPAITLSSTGKVLNRGVVSKTIADLTTSSAGKVLVRGALTKTIGPFKLHTRVIHPHSGSSDRYYLQIPRFNIDHPPSSDDLAGHLLEKLRQQQQWLDALSEAALQSANTPPLNPRFGTLRYAVGDWALTLGAVGLYIYKESGWVLIS